MDTNSTGFTSPLASTKYGSVNIPPQLEYVVDAVTNASGWTIALTILAVLVAYDQCRFALIFELTESGGSD
jgi:C-22 sterol desaturase